VCFHRVSSITSLFPCKYTSPNDAIYILRQPKVQTRVAESFALAKHAPCRHIRILFVHAAKPDAALAQICHPNSLHPSITHLEYKLLFATDVHHKLRQLKSKNNNNFPFNLDCLQKSSRLRFPSDLLV